MGEIFVYIVTERLDMYQGLQAVCEYLLQRRAHARKS